MKRLTEAWFEYNGVRSTDFDILIPELATRQQPGHRGKSKTVSGLSGSVFITDGAYDDVTLKQGFDVQDPAQVDAVNAWLTGYGKLRFSDEPHLMLDVRIDKPYGRSSIIAKLDGQRYPAVRFTAQPFKALYPAASAKTITASGTTILNPGTAPSLPRVKIAGSGNFSVTIGMETLWFLNVDGGGIIVDSEKMDAFTYDGALLANDKFEGEPFMIQPGNNLVSWTVESGSRVDSIEILPRWRYL